MRPLKLGMTAFGPYKDYELIDFTALEHRRLFVISGNTGAGKTTIFDAICFALYRKASGEDRFESSMLRSHFAREDIHTSVELEFTIGRRTYRVFRQLEHQKGANKSKTGGKDEIYEIIQGQVVPCVDRFINTEVNKKIEQIIGLTFDQFSQIVMLPQGEFRKLLTSEIENKEEILRRIFRTERYQKVEDRFQQKTKAMKTDLQNTQTELAVYVKQIAATLPVREDSMLFQTLSQVHQNVTQVVEGLDQEIIYYLHNIDQVQDQKKLLLLTLSTKETRFHEAKAINERYQALDRKQLEKAAMDTQLLEIAEREQRLLKADKAAQLEPYEEHWQKAKLAEESKRKDYERKTNDVTAVVKGWELADRRFQEETLREQERKLAERELQQLLDMQPSVQLLHASQVEVARLLDAEEQGAALVDSNEKELTSCRLIRLDQSERIKLLEQETVALPELKEKLVLLREQWKTVKETQEIERLIGEYARLETERQVALQQKRIEHDRLELLWIEGQSSLLAAHLHDGLPCPVCGSELHPSKAAAVEMIPTKEELQAIKEHLRYHEQEYNEVKGQVAAARTGLADKHMALKEHGIPAEGISECYVRLFNEGKQVKEESERLELQVKLLQQWKREGELLDINLDKLIKEKDVLIKQHQEIVVQRHAKQSLLEKELERIPESVRTPSQLAERLASQTNLVETLLQNWKQAQEQIQRMHTKLVEEKANLSQMESQLAEAVVHKQEGEIRFQTELEKAMFPDIHTYRETKLAEPLRHKLKAELETFRTTLSSLTYQIAEIERELMGKHKADLETMNEDIVRGKLELEQMTTAYQQWNTKHQEANRLRFSIVTINERLQDSENRWQQMMDVYDVLRGNNPLKMSFERYILIEFLEQILQAANERLRNLSYGQFVLQRSDRLEKHNRQSGLGLDVYDAYTGMNRDVKSLSGGEKFNASLCLALGMTDVIQAHQGGISIEMMFIDEGFGSLDEEALNKAIETLIDLQTSGRMIGVISHVQELKAAFPAVLQVHKTKEGHARTSILVK